jgi:hypothetical protein
LTFERIYDNILVSRGGTRKSTEKVKLLNGLAECQKGKTAFISQAFSLPPLPLKKVKNFSKKFLTTATKCGIIKEQ